MKRGMWTALIALFAVLPLSARAQLQPIPPIGSQPVYRVPPGGGFVPLPTPGSTYYVPPGATMPYIPTPGTTTIIAPGGHMPFLPTPGTSTIYLPDDN
jgi:hypothetical protein